MKKMNLKQLIGSSAFYMINKTIMKKVGIEAALLLQHLIDLEDSYFKGIEFYQQVDRITEDTDLSKHKIREAKKMLVKHGAITIKKKGLPSKDHFVIMHNDIQLWFKDETTTGSKSRPLEVQKVDDKDKESKRQTNNNTNIKINKKSNDDILLDKIIEKYPGNINSRGPMLKALKQLNTEDKKSTYLNIDRYKIAWEGFYHNLKNYLESRQWSDNELVKRETKNNKNNEVDTKDFDTNY